MKQALIDLDAESWFAPRADDTGFQGSLSVLLDAMLTHGLRVIGSASGPAGKIRLIIEGDSLPAECSEGWRIVLPAFSCEAHGRQRIVRVTDLRVTGRPSVQIVA
jgi:hypothetical protein